ncbi:MAG: GDSL-type esterase/lipase family protein [Bacteroidota bacterium]
MSQTAPPFWNDIVAFRKLDSVHPVQAHAVLFIGSSSFTRWKDVNDYFPGYPIVNRAFGASTLLDLIRYSYDIIIPYQPRQVVIYCGENDLAYSDTLSAAEVVKRFKTLYGIIRLNLPNAIIDYISIKPSPSRIKNLGKVKEANKEIARFLKKQKKSAFIDVFPSMVDAKGNPREELFVEDRLHMNPKGYAIWKAIILPYLTK